MWLKTLILFMVIFLMTFLANGNVDCEDTGVKSEDLIGIWKQDIPVDIVLVLRLSADGTFRMAWGVDRLDTRPVDKGEVKFEGNQVTFASSESPTCRNHIGNYNISMTEKGNFQLKVIEDPCNDRRRGFIPEWTRVKQ